MASERNGLFGRYIWRLGDTPDTVAGALGVDRGALEGANPGLRFDRLVPGSAIALPGSAPACERGALIRVAEGDSIHSLAAALDVPVAELIDENPFVDPEALVDGQLLCAPRGAGRSPAAYQFRSVRYGQALADLLIENDLSYQAFRLANPGLDPDNLLPGQRYAVPPRAMRGACAGAGRTHVIEPGETLPDLAARFSVMSGALLRLNPNLAPSDFAAGREICVSSEPGG
ncbi:MAG: LysM peptidoglycan-binding domain-containing protein [Clostridiales bacterium]|nr:LysM peptidoglycan-binding domain-containing protein [Clostridiales bacterium]